MESDNHSISSGITNKASPVEKASESEEVLQYIATNEKVKRVVDDLLRDAGALGELEQPYDIKRYQSHPDPHTKKLG